QATKAAPILGSVGSDELRGGAAGDFILASFGGQPAPAAKSAAPAVKAAGDEKKSPTLTADIETIVNTLKERGVEVYRRDNVGQRGSEEDAPQGRARKAETAQEKYDEANAQLFAQLQRMRLEASSAREEFIANALRSVRYPGEEQDRKAFLAAVMAGRTVQDAYPSMPKDLRARVEEEARLTFEAQVRNRVLEVQRRYVENLGNQAEEMRLRNAQSELQLRAQIERWTEEQLAVEAQLQEFARFRVNTSSEEAQAILEQVRYSAQLAERMEYLQQSEQYARHIAEVLVGGIEQVMYRGARLSDTLRQIGYQLAQMILRSAFLEPMAQSLTGLIRGFFVTSQAQPTAVGATVQGTKESLFSSFGNAAIGAIGKLFGFEKGGVVGAPAGPWPLPPGVHSRPIAALVAEGALPEAVVPMPDRRTVPVALDWVGSRLAARVELPGGRSIPASIRTEAEPAGALARFAAQITSSPRLAHFAEGGVVGRGAQPWALSPGVYSRPVAALVGEGALPEAVVPMPDGRSVPVALARSAPGLTARVELPGGRSLPASLRVQRFAEGGVIGNYAPIGADLAVRRPALPDPFEPALYRNTAVQDLETRATRASPSGATVVHSPVYVDARGSVHPAAIEAAAMRTFQRMAAQRRRFRQG
ncbi:MAG: hypothetical protein NZM12_12220, partial [Steroidobacteraceae bacterium]|nr:hypothetical protein [Steroidobacteraceae bacterium]MDW8259070.1 hypothetical protein [Gammaproteobacteria bacterium]